MGRKPLWATKLRALDGYAAARDIVESSLRSAAASQGWTTTGNISSNVLALPQPRKHQPLHLQPSGRPQPWELLPTRAAAYQRYPNVFNSTCMFFGSISRDLSRRLPASLVRPTKVGLDLAKMMRNLGIISSFEIFQRVEQCRDEDFLWPKDLEPGSLTELALYKHRYLKLNLRWDQHRPLWQAPGTELQQAAAAAATGGAASRTLPQHHTFDHLPLSVKNLSRASHPVFLTPDQLREQRAVRPAGIIVMFHHEMGLITDATAEHYDVPALAVAHLGLPYGHVVQISGALRQKHLAEAGLPLGQLQPMHEWSLLDCVSRSLRERALALDPKEVQRQTVAVGRVVKGKQVREDLSRARGKMDDLRADLLSWQLREREEQISSVFSTPLEGQGQGR